MVDQKKYESLAALKAEIKSLEEEAKQLQSEIIEDGGDTGIQTMNGVLHLSSRTNWEPIDNGKYILAYGEKAFIKAATISVSGIKREFGATGLDQLARDGMMTVKSISEYYRLTKK